MSEPKAHPSDLSDARWALIEPTVGAWRQVRIDRRPTGQPASVRLREVFNAILYVNRTGIPWKYLPRDSQCYIRGWDIGRRSRFSKNGFVILGWQDGFRSR